MFKVGSLESGILDFASRQAFCLTSARVQPLQDPGDPLRMNGVSEREREREREKTCETSLVRAKSARERETETETETETERMTRRGCLQGLAESGNALFFTVAFIP